MTGTTLFRGPLRRDRAPAPPVRRAGRRGLGVALGLAAGLAPWGGGVWQEGAWREGAWPGGAALAQPRGALAFDGGEFTVSTGHVIALSPVAELDCAGLRRKLAEIDATGYRGHRPRPIDRADRPLFGYENAVSQRYYTTCVAGSIHGPRDPAESAEVFRHGFQGSRGSQGPTPRGARPRGPNSE